jgi:hypothetical protein
MSWTWQKMYPEHEQESVLVCNETNGSAIAPAVRELIERMTADWLAEGHAKAEAVLMIIDATNGHIMFTWDHLDGGGDFYAERWPTYYLELKELWQASLDHERGAGLFDDEAHYALCVEVGRVLCEAEESGIEEDYVYYEKFEWRSPQRLIV